MENIEYSESGQPIYRHETNKPFETVAGSNENIALIVDHIEEYLGPIATTFHELVSDQVHIDIHIIAPTPERDFYTLITSGMSDKPMTVPEGGEDFKYAELMICLPREWDISEKGIENANNYWPMEWLKKTWPIAA